MKAKDLREKNNGELLQEKSKLAKELNDMRFKKVLSVLENPLKIKSVKRDIARINTIIFEREIEKIKSSN